MAERIRPIEQMLELNEEEKEHLLSYPLLSAKKVLYAANVSDKDLPSMENEYVAKVRMQAEKEGNLVLPFCAWSFLQIKKQF